MLNIDIPCSGRFRAERLRAGSVVEDTGWINNMILDSGLVHMASGGVSIGQCRVGTGNTPPSPEQTVLVNQLASVASGDGSSVILTAPRRSVTTYVCTFPVGAVVGNVAEVGMAPLSTGNLTTRALIRDAAGGPTTITVLADEQLRITYQLINYIPEKDVTGSFDVTTGGSTTTINYTIRPSNAGSASYGDGWGGSPQNLWEKILVYPAGSVLSDITGNGPSGDYTTNGGVGRTQTRVGNSFVTTLSFGSTQWNLEGGIGAMKWLQNNYLNAGAYGRGVWQIGFSPAFPKDSMTSGTFVFTVTYSRYTP